MKIPVITGAAAVTALGRDLAATRAALAEGRSALAPVGDSPGKDSSPAARIGSFTTEPELSRARARRLDRGSQYAVVAARQCLLHAGWDVAGREERTGILLGTGSAGAGPLTEFERQMAQESPDAASPFLFPYTVANAPASVTAIELSIKGPNVTIIQKDPAALNALFWGRLLLQDGRADAILVGAADEWNAVYHAAYESARLTRTSSRPGYALGEGAAAVLLESADSASARGARVLARAAGIALRAAAVSPHHRRAEASRLVVAIEAALQDAACPATAVATVHLSANGVPGVDEAEREAVSAVFGPGRVRTVAIKEQLGENPCIGAVQLAVAAAEVAEAPERGAILINAFGAGGNFISVVLTPA